jgi:predicted phosphodiesterase
MSKKKLEQSRVEQESKKSQAHLALLSEMSKKFNPKVSSKELIEDLRRVKELHPYKYITRDFYRIHGRYSDRCYSNKFGTFLEFRRKAGLEHGRGAAQLEKDIAKHASLDRYRGFYEMEVVPYISKYEKDQNTKHLKTILIGSDLHDKEADPFVLGVFLDTAKRIQPDIIVLNGDMFDEYEFSKFDQDPRQINLKERYDFMREKFFKPLRKACPKAQIDFIMGNHEFRILRHMADRTPNLRSLMDLMGISLSKLLGLDEHEINLVSKFDLSAYKPSEIRDEVKKNYKVYYDCFVTDHHGIDNFVMCGVSSHTHKPGFRTKVNEQFGSVFWLTTGCMAKVDAEYVPGMCQYQNSFAIVHIDPKKREVVPEHIVFSQNYCVSAGKFYKRS